MKKLLIILIVFFILVYIGYLQKEPVNYKYVENNYSYVFLESKNYELIGVRVEKKSKSLDEEIAEIFSYLTEHNSCLPVGYKNYMVLSSELTSFTYNDNELNLYLNEDFLRTNNSYALKQLYYSYTLLGFEKIYLYINEEKVKTICDINVDEGIPFFLANPVYDKYQKVLTVYHMIDNNYIKPVSYFVPDDVTDVQGELITQSNVLN